jgi:hypothetical protein
MFGNVNVDYKPCKSAVQLKNATDYILGRQPKQIRNGVVKTAYNLYWGINCDRDNFARDVLMTRQLFGKRKSKNSILAHKMSISFHPDDNDKLTYDKAFRIAKEFADKFLQGYEVLFAVHTDTEHIHAHFLIGNCNIETGKAYRRNQSDLYNMCEFFGEQCNNYGLENSVREDYYNHDYDSSHDKEKIGEHRMKARGKETFKDELREVILEETADPNNHTLQDVVNALMRDYDVECRLKGNTISYRHPNFTDKNGKLASVRGSKLGEKYTVKGIRYELEQKESARTAERTGTESRLHFERSAEKRGRENTQAVESRVYITASTGNSAGGATAGRNGTNFGNGTSACTTVGREFSGGTERRESNVVSGGDLGNVQDFGTLFKDYQRRNEENNRNRIAESGHTKTVRRKREDFDR